MIFNLAATFISAALLVPNVLGQAPTNTSQISPCILNCTMNALAAGNCASIADLPCICTSVAFQTADGTCIQANCPTELAAAMQLQNATCAGLTSSSSSSSGSASGSHSSTGTAAPGSTGSASTTHASTTTTSSSAGFHTAGIASGVALALFGAAFSLF